MEEDENRGQVSQESMEDSAQSTMDAIQTGANAIDDATSGVREKGKKYLGDKLKSTKMGKKVEKAKEKAKAVAEETEKGTKKVVKGATTLGTGAALTGLGTATQAAGASMSAAGQAITASTLGIGAAIGETMDAMGKGMQKAGQSMVKGGNKLMEEGTKTMKKGAKQIAKAPMAEPGKSSSSDGADGPIPKPKIPGISGTIKKNGKKAAKKVKKFIKEHPYIALGILAAIILLALIIFIVLAVSSTVNRGKYKEGDLSNVPYVVNQLAIQNIEVFSDGSGGYTYGFVDENGNPRTFDETIDEILKTLKENDSSALSDMGATDDERKEFLKLLIKAEVATQYPDLSVEGTGTSSNFSTASGITVQTTGKDFVVATDAANAANVLDEAGLTAAVTNSDLGEQAKQNVLGVIPDLVRLQDQYKVNALFLIAAARTESGCGTGWDLIDPSTYNWLSVKGHENGGYVDRNGTSWNRFSSYAEATESWFKLITGSDYYFKAGKYTVKEIAPTYCNSEWGETVCRYMEQFYGYAGASSDREIAAVNNTTIASSPSQSPSNIAQWGWVIQNEDINAYYYEHGYGNITYDSPYVNGYITQDGKNYIVVSNSTGWYIGQGVQLYSGGAWNDFNINLLKNHGVDTSSIQVGSTIDANVVDLVSQEIFEYKKNEIQSKAMAKGLNLTENQIVALVDISYLNGNVNTQLNNIATYGADSEQLANTSGFAACNENDTPTSRAQAVWKLFRYGKYEARSGNPYDPSYFGGTPTDSGTGTNSGLTNSSDSTSSDNNSSSGTSNSGIAQAGGVDANGVTITSGGNIDFLNYAIDCHALVREENFYYGQGRSLPVTRNDKLGYIDCSCYVSMALDAYGLNDWSGYPHQLTASGGSLVAYAREKNFEFIYEGSASSINQIPDIQSGDIVLMPGHTQIFYGYTSSGDSVWLNCGSTKSILKQEGDEHGWYATPITYVIRVPGGSGNGYSGNRYSRKAVEVLTNNEDSVEGKIKIKRKDSSGKEIWLEYIDEGSFDSMIQSNNSDVMNYYTLKKGASITNSTGGTTGNTTGGMTGGATLTGSETKEQIWNFLIDSGLTEQGAAGLMGNLESESDFNSMCVEDDWTKSNKMEFDTEYTRKVDSGEISESTFVTTGGINPGHKGYGLAQWTTQDRKQNLYNYVKSKGTSIGDLQTQLEFLVQELQTSYSSVWSVITTSSDINECSDIVLRKFEIPRDISGQTPKRRQNASNIYSTYMGTRTAGGSGTLTATGGNATTTQGTSAIATISNSATSTSGAVSNTRTAASSPEMAIYQNDGYDFNRFWLMTISYEDWDVYSYRMNLPDNVTYEGGYNVKKKISEDRQTYIVGRDEAGNPDVGMGVWLGSGSSNFERFESHGISSSSLVQGFLVSCDITDQVSQEELLDCVEKARKDAAKNGVTLKEYQLQAIADAYYNYGAYASSCKSFWTLYKQYGESDELAKQCGIFNYVPENTTYESLQNLGHGTSRKSSRWMLFKYGKYIPRHKAYYGNELELNIAGATAATVSFDNFLFLGDSRYVGIKSELEALGNNVSVCAVSSSTAKDWSSIIDSGSGTVLSTSITLPDSASGVSVMLGANAGAYQIPELKEVMEKLHTRYPSAKIYFNSVYHLGSNYTYANVDDTIAGYDRVNEEMKTFCSSNSDWAVYVDITNGLHDENGYLKYPDDEGIHLVGEGKTILVDNIKNNIKGAVTAAAASSSSSNDGSEGIATSSTYVIAVASYDQKTVTSVDSYQYAYTKVISTNSGTTGYGSQFSSTPAGRTTTNTTLTYKTSYIDYQPALKNHTLYFDFLWATFITTGDKKLAEEMAQEALDSKLEITVYQDTKVTQNVSTSTLQPKILYMKDGSTAYEDHYNGTNTTTTTNTIVSSKGCLTLANVWNMEYENNAGSYSEFKSKSKENVREKIEDDDNIMVILRKRERAKTLDREYYMLEDMLEENGRVSHMIDVFRYYVDIAKKSSKKKAKVTTSNIIDTNLFDLSHSESVSTVKVLMYTRLNISESEKEMMYNAVEQMTAGFTDDDKNTQRKKYITSVILNRALSSQFPDSVADVLNQTGQFPNYNAQSGGTYSDSTKAAVDAVIAGGDCAKYSVYFNTPSGAEKLNWNTKYKKTFNDGDGSDSSYTYYADEAITKELQSFEVSVASGATMASDAAQKIVAWAEAQVGKSSFYNSHAGKEMVSTNYCAAFVKCAYYEAGFSYIGGNAKDIPHPNEIQFNDDGTVNYSNIPVGAVIVSKGVPVGGVDYGHVCLYVGNGYVIEAGGSTVQKKPIDDSFGGKGHNCAPFVGWGFAAENQDEAYQQLVVNVGGGAAGGNYEQGWTKLDCGPWADGGDSSSGTGIQGVFTAGDKSFKVFCQGAGPWANTRLQEPSIWISDAGCGITSISIVLTGLGFDVTPDSFAGQHSAGDQYVEQHLSEYGVNYKKLSSMSEIVEELQKGNPIIYHVSGGTVGGKSYGGHYVTLLGINEQGEIFLGDPGSTRNSGYFPQSKFTGLRSAYAVWK